MKPKVWNEGWRNQYDRMVRSIGIMAGAFASSDQYDDAFYHAAQDAWHLKDWIKNDDRLSPEVRATVLEEAHNEEPLKVVQDLANCTKHFMLTSWQGDSPSELHSSSVVVNLGKKTIQRTISVRISDGITEKTAEQVLREAQAAWDKVLRRHGLLA